MGCARGLGAQARSRCPPAVVLGYLGALLAHGQDNRYGTGQIGSSPVAAASWRQRAGGGLCALEPVITGTPLDPHVVFAELGRMKLGESDLQAVLGRVAELARQTLPGMAGASVTLVESDRALTAAFSGQLA